MTLINNSLGDKLNNYKNKKISPLKETDKNNLPYLSDLFTSIFFICMFLFKSFVFGYSLKLIFHTDWKFWSLLCIGLSISLIFENINNITHNKNS